MTTKHKFTMPLRLAAVLAVTLGVGVAFAASSAIGLAVANGSFQVDRAQVWGSSSLFEGSTVETARAISQIQVNGDAAVRLAADSRVQIYRSRMVLEQGFTEVRSATGFTVEARSLTITPRSRQAVTRIKLQGARKVIVAALDGSVDVRNAGGVLVARVAGGSSLDFEPQTGGATAQSGTGSASQAGASTAQAGARSGASASTGEGATAAGASGAAGAAAAGTAAAAGAAGGIGVGTIAIIGGVAVAATLGGLAATGSLPGQSQSSPSASQ